MNFLTTDILLLQQLSGLHILDIDAPVLSYDSLKKQVVYAFTGRNSNLDEFLIEIRIKRLDLYRLEEINIYSPQPNIPPPLVLTNLGVIVASNEINGTIIATNEIPSTPTIPTIPTLPPQTTLTGTPGQTIFNLSTPVIFQPQNTPNTVFLL
jgi:hypothetical protein